MRTWLYFVAFATMIFVVPLVTGPISAAQAASEPESIALTLSREGAETDVLDLPARLHVQDESLQAALLRLRNGGGIPLAFSPTVVGSDVRVTCHCWELTVGEAILILLDGTGLEVVRRGNHLVIREARVMMPSPVVLGLAPESARVASGHLGLEDELLRPHVPRQGTIQGRVLEARTLQPLVGASVHLPELEIGVLSRPDGRFVINDVPSGSHTVEVRRLGFRSASQTVTVSTGEVTEVTFELIAEAIALDAVVVTGTVGAAARREIGNVVERMDVSELLERVPTKEVPELLMARFPGVLVKPGGGRAAAGSRIRIRGRSSLSLDTEPLIYIDGVRVDNTVGTGPALQGGQFSSRITDLNPDEIESIEVIKGPAAATLYGTEAASGVIQVITRRGSEGVPTVNFRMRQGATWLSNPEGRFPTNVDRDPNTGELVYFNAIAAETERGTPVFRTGHLQGYHASVSGGGGGSHYFFSGDFDRDEGIERPDVSRRISTRANLGTLLGESLDIRSNFGLTVVRTDVARDYSPTASVIGAAMRARPLLRNTDLRGFWARPPEVIYESFDLTQDVDRFTTSLNFNHQLTDQFTHRLTVGGEVLNEINSALTPRLRPEIAAFWGEPFSLGSKRVDERRAINTTVDYAGTLTLPVTDQIESRTSGGMQYYRRSQTTSMRQGDEFPAPGLETIGAAARRISSDDFIQNVTVGVFLQQQVAFRDRLYLTGAVRADDNSAFGADFSFVFYPKASVSWVISEEDFWDVPYVEQLRLRAAYGASGQQPDVFAARRLFSPVTSHGDGAGVTPGAFGNPDLGPERGEELELGFEASLFRDRLGIDFTFYNQITRDALMQRNIPQSLGFPGSQWINAGKVRNRGFEMLLTGIPLDRSNLAWQAGLNVSANFGEVLDLGGPDQIITGQIAGHAVGDPPFSWYLKRIVQAEIGPDGLPQNVLCDGGPGSGPVPCEDAPLLYRGNTEPVLTGAITNEVTLYRNFTLHVMADFQVGRRMRAQNAWVRCSSYRVCEQTFFPEEYDPIEVAYVVLAGSDYNLQWDYIKSADFLKLREVGLNVRLTENVLDRIGASRGSLTVAARHLHTWSPWSRYWSELDPEIHQLTNFDQQFSQAVTPMTASFVTTVSLTY